MSMAEKGFTLVEVVVALTVLAVGILGISVIFPLSSHDVSKSGMSAKALELCQEKIEELHDCAYDAADLTPAVTHVDSLNPIVNAFERSWYVQQNQPIPGCKTIHVTVEWLQDSERFITLSTVISGAGR
jgi:prepilin-type N-terminal cleavage/methylation domain-containing protein